MPLPRRRRATATTARVPTPVSTRGRAGGGSPQAILLGIEAGATRTVALAVGVDGSGPLRVERGPANLQLMSDDQLARHLRGVARALPRPTTMAIGMAGARTENDRARLRGVAARVWPGVPCIATSDLETALMASVAQAPADSRARTPRAPSPAASRSAASERQRTARERRARVLIISGTGSCTFGRAPSGRTARVGGWGHVIGDRASGHDIVIQALRAVVQAADRHGRWPRLGERMLRALGLDEPHDLVTWVQSAGKTVVAALAPEVFGAAGRGDRLAREVLAGAAATLAGTALTCARRVARPGAPVDFVLAGSVLLKQPRFADRVGRLLRRGWPGATVSRLEREGAWGAVALARLAVATS